MQLGEIITDIKPLSRINELIHDMKSGKSTGRCLVNLDANKKILVLGSNSFSGASFCEYLLSNEHKVFGISRSNLISPVFHEQLFSAFADGSFKYFQVDINSNFDELIGIINKEK